MLYDSLAEKAGIDRAQAKRELFRDVLFGRPHVEGRLTKAFAARWPNIIAWVRHVKQEHGYKIIAMALQRLESLLVLDGACVRMIEDLPGVPFLTIHDSAMLVTDAAEAVREIMLAEFAKWGAKPKINVKGRAS